MEEGMDKKPFQAGSRSLREPRRQSAREKTRKSYEGSPRKNFGDAHDGKREYSTASLSKPSGPRRSIERQAECPTKRYGDRREDRGGWLNGEQNEGRGRNSSQSRGQKGQHRGGWGQESRHPYRNRNKDRQGTYPKAREERNDGNYGENRPRKGKRERDARRESERENRGHNRISGFEKKPTNPRKNDRGNDPLPLGRRDRPETQPRRPIVGRFYTERKILSLGDTSRLKPPRTQRTAQRSAGPNSSQDSPRQQHRTFPSGSRSRPGAAPSSTSYPTPESRNHDSRAGDKKTPTQEETWRISRRIALAGRYSRRSAEERITSGNVRVNSKIEMNLNRQILRGDRVEVDGRLLPPIVPPKIWCYHKPRGIIATRVDPAGRPTISMALKRFFPSGVTPFLVGRLDFNSEGLLLLTNHGALSRYLELPSSGFTRGYRVRAFGTLDAKTHAHLSKGPTINGVCYRPVVIKEDSPFEKPLADHEREAIERRTHPQAKFKESQPTGRQRKVGPDESTNSKDNPVPRVRPNRWYRVEITEGKNREVRRLFEYGGLQVSRLIRVAYGPFELGDLKAGDMAEVSESACYPLALAAGLTLELPEKPSIKRGYQRAQRRVGQLNEPTIHQESPKRPTKKPTMRPGEPPAGRTTIKSRDSSKFSRKSR